MTGDVIVIVGRNAMNVVLHYAMLWYDMICVHRDGIERNGLMDIISYPIMDHHHWSDLPDDLISCHVM